MMEQTIRALCAVSILCGAALSLCPEGQGKRALSFVCSVAVLACAVNCLAGLDWQEYALEGARLRDRQEAFLQQSTEVCDKLDRTVIEQRYEAYALEAARSLGLRVRSVRILSHWSLEGFWVPYQARVEGKLTEEEKGLLAGRLEADLGISRERQEWVEDDG